MFENPFQFDLEYLQYLDLPKYRNVFNTFQNIEGIANAAVSGVNNIANQFRNARTPMDYGQAAASTVNAIGNVISSIKENKLNNQLRKYQNASLIAAAVNKANTEKRNKERSIEVGMADNLYATAPGGDRGDWGVTGTIYGQFRPNQMGSYTWYGMNQGLYYPTYDEGGEFSAGNVNHILDSSAGELSESISQIPLPEFALPPNPLTGFVALEGSKKSAHVNVNVNINESAKKAFNYYVKEKGLPEHAAAGIVGNLYQESGVNPRIGDGDKRGGIGGVAQWDPNRSRKLIEYAASRNKSPYDLYTQLDFILEEPGIGPKVLEKLKKSSSPTQAAKIFMDEYERPHPKYAHFDKRAKVAEKLFSGQFEEGGEYEMTEEELQSFLAAGGQVEYI